MRTAWRRRKGRVAFSPAPPSAQDGERGALRPAAQLEATSPTWASLAEIPAVVRFPGHLRKTTWIAAIVGIVLFCINQLDVVLSGYTTPLVWFKIGLTFLVPFCVSNYGILVATHRGEATT